MDISCPRCGASVVVDYYAPCDPCRDQLRATMRAEEGHAEGVTAVEYEPKMNVTPNAVALKDD